MCVHGGEAGRFKSDQLGTLVWEGVELKTRFRAHQNVLSNAHLAHMMVVY
jgi:hypothetical protein